mmetsp:Transcript_25085/g.38840  ORF Transcript_25085/g.38840 Transcript_25085/m.38840 type:complete len:103 (-) Transcript_25085:103-411(-)
MTQTPWKSCRTRRTCEAPRHGPLGDLPQQRTEQHCGQRSSPPREDASQPCHPTAFQVSRAGRAHLDRGADRLGALRHQQEAVAAVLVLGAAGVHHGVCGASY